VKGWSTSTIRKIAPAIDRADQQNLAETHRAPRKRLGFLRGVFGTPFDGIDAAALLTVAKAIGVRP